MKETVDYQIKATWHSISRMYNQIASKYGLSQAMGFVLINIDKDIGTPATKIAPLLGMEATSLTRLLKSMEVGGLIVRKKDVNDGRMMRVCLTKTGLEKRKIAKRVIGKFNDQVLKVVSENELAVFLRIMEKVNQSIDSFKKIETA